MLKENGVNLVDFKEKCETAILVAKNQIREWQSSSALSAFDKIVCIKHAEGTIFAFTIVINFLERNEV